MLIWRSKNALLKALKTIVLQEKHLYEIEILLSID